MAPLYNRYVPPKPSAPAAAPHVSSTPPAPAPATPEADKKRKRERSEEQKAERKSKKLRNKDQDEPAVEEPLQPVQPQELSTDEARKARKEAAKNGDDTETAVTGDAQAEDDGAIARALGQSASDEIPSAQKSAVENTVEDATLKDSTKRKKKRKDADQEQAPDAPTQKVAETNGEMNQDETMIDAADEEVDTSQPKKRRHKLEDALQKAKEPERKNSAAEIEEDHLKNYAGVMDKFQKARQLAEKKEAEKPKEEAVEAEPEVQKRDLAPFPQPVNEPKEYKPTFSALPSWLADPTTISDDTKASFANLGLPESTVKHLADLSFRDALPVQQALIPLLLQPGTKGSRFLPGTESVLPDVAVSAATGSGKTIAYLLPMIEALKKNQGSFERLRGLVVVPTRELVMQVAAVAESLAKGSNLKVGISSGVGRFKDEQQRLVHTGRRYDPVAYAELMRKAHRKDNPPSIDSEDFDAYAEELEHWTERDDQEIQDALHGLVDHVPTHTSAVDILICTPGRLLEHLGSTPGFSIASVGWLVLDEADKLLDQQYDGFLQRLDEDLSIPRSDEEQDAREKYLRSKGLWDDRFERQVRKVVLSATMTRDISKLTALKLRRPQLVVVQGAEQQDSVDASAGANAKEDVDMVNNETGAFEIPPTLKEYCVPVGDGSEKPLQLLELLQSRVLLGQPSTKTKQAAKVEEESDSDSDSDSSSSDSSSSDESDSDDSSSSSSDDSSEDESDDDESSSDESDASSAKQTSAPTVLIFTSSTESAARLSHLLRNLRPDLSEYITTLTKTTNNTTHRPSNSTDPVITISTDRAGRGLDTLSGRRITHVLQYDVPRALTAYVHRVGRTARAGASGEAWTLYSDREARWFVNEIMRAANVRRPEPIERVRFQVSDDGLKDKFADVLAGMRETVFGANAK
ncbi:hypothetical protein Q7P37_010537 [Cladosporium fusiforme]